MPTIAIRIPSGMDTKEAKRLLIMAIKHKLSPAPVSAGQTQSARIALNAVEISGIAKISPDSTIQDSASRLILAALADRDAANAPRPSSGDDMSILDSLVDAGVIGRRPGQFIARDTIKEALAGRGVTMLEAPTGSGKTMAQLCAAVDFLRAASTENRVVIAVPTINLMRQIEREYETMGKSGQSLPSIAYIVGRARFVSEFRIRLLLQDVMFAPLAGLVDAWLSAQRGKTGQTVSDLPFQAENFYAEFPDFPPVWLDSDCKKEDSGVIAYQAHRSHAENAKIVVVSHAMLALDARLRRFRAMTESNARDEGIEYVREQYESAKESGEDRPFSQYLIDYLSTLPTFGALPAYQHLIVDEGDVLEQSASSVSADEISLFALTRNHSLSNERRRAILSQFNMLVKVGSSYDSNSLSLNNYVEQSMSPEAAAALAALRAILDTLRDARKKDVEAKRAQKALEHMERNMSRHLFAALLDFSPAYRYPRLRIGEKSVADLLQHLWGTVKSAVVISATLALPRGGDLSTQYIAGNLHIRGAKTCVIHAPEWLFSPVTLYMPPEPNSVEPGGRTWLKPPSQPVRRTGPEWSKFETDRDAWLREVAGVMEWSLDTARGGTLVLLSSYDIAERLSALVEPFAAGRIVCASRDAGITAQRERFVSLYEQGLRPVWFAVGSAWRGLDLIDIRAGHDEADKDLLLTDLIIPRLPLGMNQTLSHAWRKQKMTGWIVECNEAMMYLKQGFGRLVRREGLTNCRRLFLLDSRAQAARNYAVLSNGIRMITRGYFKKVLSK